MATYDDVHGKFTGHGFAFLGIEEDGDALYTRRTSPVCYVTAPCGTAGQIPDSVVHKIMETAGIPYTDYRDIVNSEP